MKTKKAMAYILVNRGTFIAAFRHKPKRVREGEKGHRYWAWVDVNGPRYRNKKEFPYAENAIEGTMNAKLIRCEITYTV